MTRQALSQRMTMTNPVARLRFELVAAEFLVRMGARIKERRLALGLSRAELARQMPGRVNENQVYRWEVGKHLPNPDTLQALAAQLGCDVAELMAPEPATHKTPDPFPANGTASVEDRLDAIEEAIRQFQADRVIRDAEVLQQIAEGVKTILDSLPGQQP